MMEASEKPEEVEPEPVKGSTRDGPRYVASLQKANDPCCYKDFFETEKQYEAQEKAEAAVSENNRAALVYDRMRGEIICRISPITDVETKEIEPIKRRSVDDTKQVMETKGEPIKRRRGRPRKRK